ncbi:hypothetical protein Tco_1066971 [Tanacetum coccineum]|uniref:Uncharacterized protein n=1 Tax=Tanacetum coccineum TaxID=301880 RepID=A0ABQ5HBK4_9ASTR
MRNEIKARGTLLMALPNKDQIKLHSYKDAKLLMEAIEKRYGGNKESKKVQRTLLKQQYENFVGLSSEIMDQTFDSTNSNSSTNEADNIAYGVSDAHTQSNHAFGDNLSDAVICAFLASQPNSPQLAKEDLEQIHPNDLEEMDLQWEMAMLTIRGRRFIKRTGRKLDVNGQRVGFDRAPRNQENKGREINRRTMTVETPTKNALVAQDGFGGYDWSYQAEEEHPINIALMAFTSLGSSSSLDSEENNKSKSDKGYHVVPPPYTGNFIPFKPDLTFMDEIVESENMDVTTIGTPSNVIEDWISDDEREVEIIPKVKTVSSSTEKIKFVKYARETVEKVIRPVWNNSSRVNHKNFANKMTHPHPNRRFVLQAVLTRSSKINTAGANVNTAVRPVNTAGSKPTVNHPRPISNAYKKGYLQVIRPFNKYSEYKNSIFNKKVNTARVKDTTARDRAVVSENKGKGVNVVKASTC